MNDTVYIVPTDSGNECKEGTVAIAIDANNKISQNLLWQVLLFSKPGAKMLRDKALQDLQNAYTQVGICNYARFCLPDYDESNHRFRVERLIEAVMNIPKVNISKLNCNRAHKGSYVAPK